MKLLEFILILAAIAPAALVSADHVQAFDLRARSGSYGLARIGVPMRSADHHRRHHARSIAQPVPQLAPRAEDDCGEESGSAAVSTTNEEDCTEDDTTGDSDNGQDCEEGSTSSTNDRTPLNAQTSTSSNTRTTTTKKASQTSTKHSTSKPSSSSSAASKQKGGGGGSSGTATFFTQDGTIGACGIGNKPVPDTDKVVALCPSQFKAACGKQIQITNKLTGKTTTAKGNDECPSCDCNHLDLSLGAWDALGSARSVGVIDISFQIL